jgi:hypothetical protein
LGGKEKFFLRFPPGGLFVLERLACFEFLQEWWRRRRRHGNIVKPICNDANGIVYDGFSPTQGTIRTQYQVPSSITVFEAFFEVF